jgi:hypothetical protein
MSLRRSLTEIRMKLARYPGIAFVLVIAPFATGAMADDALRSA